LRHDGRLFNIALRSLSVVPPQTPCFSLHFHTSGWLRPWRRECFIESSYGHVVPLTRDQATYILIEAPKQFTHALHWLKMSWPNDEFKMIDRIV